MLISKADAMYLCNYREFTYYNRGLEQKVWCFKVEDFLTIINKWNWESATMKANYIYYYKSTDSVEVSGDDIYEANDSSQKCHCESHGIEYITG